VATGLFGRFSVQQLGSSRGLTQSPSVGSCAVSPFRGLNPSPVDPVRPVPFDAGASLSITGPAGNKTIPRAATGVYSATLGGASLDQLLTGGTPPPPYLDAGEYTISGSGGPGGDTSVGSFTARVTLPAPVNWTNQSITEIVRSSDQEITWTGGDPNGFVAISVVGFSAGPAGPSADSVGNAVLCLERASAGRFRIPSFVLQALPAPSEVGIIPPAFVLVGSTARPVPFEATNLDKGYLTFRTLAGKGVRIR
jgi:hypothetical protein